MGSKWTVLLKPSAQRSLDKLLREAPELWDEAVGMITDFVEDGPDIPGAGPLEDYAGWYRARLSHQYRIVYRVSEKQKRIFITRIRHRSDAYQGLTSHRRGQSS